MAPRGSARDDIVLWVLCGVVDQQHDLDSCARGVILQLHVVPRYKGAGFGLRFPADYPQKPERSELDRRSS
jgi:hypothetical protein